MKIRTRLTILFTLLTATILLAFAAVIYYTAKENREQEFYTLLKKEAITKANLFLNASVDKKTLQDIYHNNRKILNEVEVAIYDTSFNLLYHDAVDIDFVKENRPMIDEINQKGEISFYQQRWQVIGLRYDFDNKKYIITAAAYDQYGYNKLYDLLKNSIILFIVSIVFIYIAGRFFSKKAFGPVMEMTDRVKSITATHLDLRLNTNGSKDELAELANTFNEMLDRLENSFDAQKQFVSNIAHELRTPLSAIITELELSSSKQRSSAEYKIVIENSLNDARRLAKLSNSLLDLAKASYDQTEIAFKPLRLDEILLDARNDVLHNKPGYKVNIAFEKEIDDDQFISVNGNEYLLKTAFSNLIENGCKFSGDRQSIVSISYNDHSLILRFSDKGIGIADDEQPHIFTPFYRGRNRQFSEGNGIGLFLTKKIITLHNGTVSITSRENEGTTFTIMLPHL